MQKKTLKIILISLLIVVLVVVVGLWLIRFYAKKQMAQIPNMSFAEVLEYTTHDNTEAVITVGILQDGNATYTVYGNNGEELEQKEHIYEIGSITKTITASLIGKAVEEGRIDLDQTIDHYLELPAGKSYPTIKELLTHTSGYKNFYFASPMTSNFFFGRNSFYNVKKEAVLDRVAALDMEEESYPFNYSNFGFAVLGLVLEDVYETYYTTLVNEYLSTDLGMPDTRISTQDGDLGNYWDWAPTDAYLSAGGLTSDISDMLRYAEHLLAMEHRPLTRIDTPDEQLALMGIHMDAVGMAWIFDREQDIIWHNGGTGNYNSYIGFDPKNQTAVVVLSNLPPRERIPATILGLKLLNELRDQ